jgi:hypothetical protein
VTSLPWKELRENAGDDGVTRVPDGWYDCTIKSTKVGQTSSGYKKINTRFVVMNGPYAGGGVFKDFIITNDKPGGLKFFFRHMAVLGITNDQFTDDLSLEMLADRLLDRTAQVQVGTRVWNEQEYAEVKDLKVLTTGSVFDFTPLLPTPAVPGPVFTVSEAPMLVTPEPPVSLFDNELPPEPPF